MKKIIKFIKNNILGFLVGLSLCLNGVVIAENIITANQVTYNDSTVQTELDSLFDAVDINERLGDTISISNIGTDGTVSGAIKAVDDKVVNIIPEISSLSSNVIAEPHFYISRGVVEKLQKRYLIYGTIGCDSTTVSANTNTFIGTLKIKPFESTMIPLNVMFGGNVVTNGVLIIDTDGKMYINIPVDVNYIVASFTAIIYTE